MILRIALLTILAGMVAYLIRCARKTGTRTADAFGIRLDSRASLDIPAGLLIAGLVMGAIFLFQWWFGWVTVQSVDPAAALTGNSLTLILGAFLEELAFRGVLLGCLILLLHNITLAVALSAALFAAAHLGNKNVDALAFMGYCAGGAVYGMAYWRTGRLWLPFGLHLGWNFAQGKIFGFAVSGGSFGESYITQQSNGPALWTGGVYGPEAGLLGLVARFVVLGLTLAWLRLRYAGFRSLAAPAQSSH
jgi:membrane protease YdiL (CAAX protease family)